MEPNNNAQILREHDSRNTERINRIYDILKSAGFSEKSKIYEIKKIVNSCMIDYIESRKKIDNDFFDSTSIQKVLLPEDF